MEALAVSRLGGSGTKGTLRTRGEGLEGFKQALSAFLGALDVASSSRGTYERQLRRFTLWLEQTGRDASKLKREDVLAFKVSLAGLSAYSVAGYLTAVRRLFEYLEAERVFPNVARDVKAGAKPRGFRKDILTPAQVRDVLAGIDTESLEGRRNFALLNLLARTGLRTIEAARANLEDVRQEGGEAVLWVQGKGRVAKDDFVLLTPETLKPLRAYLSARKAKEGEALFSGLSNRNKGRLTTRTISRIAKDAFRAANLDSARLTAHSLRHTAVSLAVQGGASLQQAQAMARHSDPKTTLIYFHNLDRVKSGAEKCISF